jgi:hypothetical protein
MSAVEMAHQALQTRRSKWLILLTANTDRRSLNRSQARGRSVVGTNLSRLNYGRLINIKKAEPWCFHGFGGQV